MYNQNQKPLLSSRVLLSSYHNQLFGHWNLLERSRPTWHAYLNANLYVWLYSRSNHSSTLQRAAHDQQGLMAESSIYTLGAILFNIPIIPHIGPNLKLTLLEPNKWQAFHDQLWPTLWTGYFTLESLIRGLEETLWLNIRPLTLGIKWHHKQLKASKHPDPNQDMCSLYGAMDGTGTIHPLHRTLLASVWGTTGHPHWLLRPGFTLCHGWSDHKWTVMNMFKWPLVIEPYVPALYAYKHI